MKKVKRIVLRILPHLLLLGFAAFAVYKYHQFAAMHLGAQLELFTYITLGLAMVMSTHFQRSRAFFLLLLMTLAYAGVMENDRITPYIQFFENYSRAFLSLLVPVAFGLIAFSRERGFITPPGILKWLLILAAFTLMFYLGYSGNRAFLDLVYLEALPPVLTLYTALSDIALILSLIALVALIVRSVLAPSHLNLGMLMTFLAVQAAVNFADRGELFSLFILIGAAMLIIALLSESYYLAHYDELTAIPARRALLAHFGTLGRKYTVAMVDIDHFKQFNDTHGHDVGDEVLQLVASRLEGVTGGGSAYRYGGEEFTIVFPGKSTEEAKPHLEEVRQAVEKSSHSVHVKNRKNPKLLSVTISIGAAEKKPEDKEPTDVLKRADNALYKAKKAGRNRVTLG